ncbi:Uncharacterised protein [Mycobacteroides abscessus subsp. abscessus]|nr:Uncharacterised protein [Mycobacteroides abscessus subsp. abscessus]
MPTQNVLYPLSWSTCPIVAHCAGSRPAAPGYPSDPSVIEAKRFTWWLRPVSRHERVGEHSAVVCHCE